LTSLDLRPLSLGELLDRSFRLYRQYFWLFVGIMAVPSVLALALALVVAMINPDQAARPAPDQMGRDEAIATMIWFLGMMVVMVVMTVVYLIAYAVALGATTVAVSEIYMGRPVTIKGAYARLRGRLGRLILLLMLLGLRFAGLIFLLLFLVGLAGGLGVRYPIVAGLLLAIGLLGLIALWIWMALRYPVAIPVMVLEDRKARASIQRSIELTRGSAFRVFVLLLFTAIVTYAVLAIVQGPFLVAIMMAGPESSTAFVLNLIGTVAGSVGSALTAPLMIVAFAVLYYDLRVRREGLDLQVMIGNLGAAAPAPGPPAAAPSPLFPG
jgi:MFS family permease